MQDRRKARELLFTDHIVLLLYTNDKTPTVGLASFVLPLRASNLHKSHMKHIVIVGNKAQVQRLWPQLENTARLTVFHGNPLSMTDLLAVNIGQCHMCAVVSARTSMHDHEDPTIVDKEALLITLNVKALYPHIKIITLLSEGGG